MQKIDTYLNRVTVGNSIEVMGDLPDDCIDLILSNPEYQPGANEGNIATGLSALWEQYQRIIKPSGAIVLIASSALTAKLILSNPDWLNYKIVWIKHKVTDILGAKKQPVLNSKDICIYYNKRPFYCPQKQLNPACHKSLTDDQETGRNGKWQPTASANSGVQCLYDIVGYNEDVFDWICCLNAAHEFDGLFNPDHNPVDLGRFMIKKFTLPNQIVLDNASESGTFLVSAILENRRFIGIEKNRPYFKNT